jgi:hypothetical protein
VSFLAQHTTIRQPYTAWRPVGHLGDMQPGPQSAAGDRSDPVLDQRVQALV